MITISKRTTSRQEIYTTLVLSWFIVIRIIRIRVNQYSRLNRSIDLLRFRIKTILPPPDIQRSFVRYRRQLEPGLAPIRTRDLVLVRYHKQGNGVKRTFRNRP